MDDDTNELIAQLGTRFGMIMEDASMVALSLGGLAGAEQSLAIEELATEASRIHALLEAVKALATYDRR